jgi:MFS family permease
MSSSASAPLPGQARLAAAIFFVVSGFGYATWASRIPTLQHRLGLNEAQLGSVLLALPAGLMLTLPVTSWLLQRFSSRRIMLVGAVCFNLFLSLLGFAAHTWQLVLILFCFGASRNLLNISMNAQSVSVQALYPHSIIASFHGLWSVAGFAAAALTAVLVPAGLPSWLQFVTVSSLLTGLALAFFPRTLHVAPQPSGRKAGFVWPDRQLLRFGLVAFASMACEGAMYDWSSLYFAKAVRVPASLATLGFVLYMVAMTTGRLVGDRLVGRFGTVPLLRYSGWLVGGGLLLAAAVPTLPAAGVGFVLVGLGVSCIVPLVFGLAGKSATLGSGPAIAAVSTVGYVGFLLVPPVIGFIAEAASLRWAFLLIALLGGLIVWLVQRLEPAGAAQ